MFCKMVVHFIQIQTTCQDYLAQGFSTLEVYFLSLSLAAILIKDTLNKVNQGL